MDLARVIIFTGDVRRSVDFYAATFGLEVVGEFDDGWTEMKAGGCKIAFHKAAVEVLNGSDDGIKFVFGSDDVARDRARLVRAGIVMTEIVRWGTAEYCDGSDPDGHRFQISSR